MKNLLALLLMITQLLSCKNNKTMEEKYEWGAGISTEIGFPVRIYAGRVGDMTIMSGFTASLDKPDDGWGVGYSEGSMKKHLPKDLDIVWLSYVEDCFYRVKGNLDYVKILSLFREGFKYRVGNLEAYPTGYREVTYNTIVVGLAPGGTVVVWISGLGRQIEIGRFQAEKIELKQPEGLDSHESLIFSKEERERVLSNKLARPPHIAEKPTPYGLWDSYRDIKYPWYPTFEFFSGAKMGDFFIEFFNKEKWDVFYDKMALETPARKDYSSDAITLIPDIFYQKGEDVSEKERPLPKRIGFGYKANNDTKYWGYYEFDWEETKEVFAEYFDKYPNTRARLNVRVNKINTLFTIRLENEKGDGVFIPFHREKLRLIAQKSNDTRIPPLNNY
ncbi:DUF2931 family protein [Capnocytophaga cynodegmi]|uniref:DUF2931 family protein n=1 Tax=Capnocytophaga cynodegmi TaxID=28189 RepID=UPI00385F4AF7